MDDQEPEATIWRAVAELEQKFFTKKEISDALFEISTELHIDEAHGKVDRINDDL